MAKEKAKKDKKGKGSPTTAEGLRLNDHPRARRGIRKARAYGGLAGLFLTAYVAHKGGLQPFDVGLRALIGGIVGSLLGRAVAVVAWRQLVVAEVRAAHARIHAPTPPPAPTEPQVVQ